MLNTAQFVAEKSYERANLRDSGTKNVLHTCQKRH
jgi:hypothetical protein